MLYVKSRKNFEVRRENFFYFAVCLNKTHGKACICRVSEKSTRQSMAVPCAKKTHTSEHGFAVCQKMHTAKHDFAVCAHDQRLLYHVPDRKHTANTRFAIIYAWSSTVAKKRSISAHAVQLLPEPCPMPMASSLVSTPARQKIPRHYLLSGSLTSPTRFV